MARTLTEVDGISNVHAGTLAQAGLSTTDDLLQSAGMRPARALLARRTLILESWLLVWVNRADLMRAGALDRFETRMLNKAGVETINDLKDYQPEILHGRLEAMGQAKSPIRDTPLLSEVEAWVTSARTLEVLVEQ